MQPVVCGHMMFFEEFLPTGVHGDDGPKWTISMVEVDPWPPNPGASRLVGLEERGFGGPISDLSRTYNFREPACRPNLGSGGWDLAFAGDFNSTFTPFVGLPLAWSVYNVIGVQPIGLVDSRVMLLSGFDTCAARRPAVADDGNWFYDCSDGNGSEILDSNQFVVLANNANNQAPAYQQDENGNGLLVYQSDLAGSVDLYLAQILGGADASHLGGVFRLTHAPGWEGSAVWLP